MSQNLRIDVANASKFTLEFIPNGRVSIRENLDALYS